MVVRRGLLPAVVAACAVLLAHAQDAAPTPEPTPLALMAGAGGVQQLVCHTYIVKFFDAARSAAGNQSATSMVHSGLGAGGAAAAITGFKSFNSSAFASYVVINAPASTAAALAALPSVESVVQDFLVFAASVSMVPLPPSAVPPSIREPSGDGGVNVSAVVGGGVRGGRQLLTRSGWNPGLDRLDQRTGPIDGAYKFYCSRTRPGGNSTPHVHSDGAGVDVYVMDSGVHHDHSEFGTRVNMTLARNYVNDAQVYGSTNATDGCSGHGTFVASQIGGSVLGVAPAVRIIPIRVFGCNGAGSYSALLAAVDYIVMTAPTTGRKSIVNFSGGATSSLAYDLLADRLMEVGAPLVVAAGNDGVSACTRSPARAASAFTVGAADPSDAWAPFSNYGGCVNIAAVGVDNIGAWNTEDDSYAVGSGTSFAAPLVTGLAAMVWAALPANASWATVTGILTAAATRDRLMGLPAGTPNLLAFSGPTGGVEELVASWSATATVTPTLSGTPSITPSASGSASVTPSASGTPTLSSTPASLTPSVAASATRSCSASASPSRVILGFGAPSQSRPATRTRTASRTRSRVVKTSPSRSKSRSQSRKPKPRKA
jgi:subtilisin family serine protease